MSCSVKDHGFVCVPILVNLQQEKFSQLFLKSENVHLRTTNDTCEPTTEDPTLCLSKKQIILEYVSILLLVLGCGTFSGLTIGLTSIDRLSLEIDAKSDPSIKQATERIFPVIDQHHWMLVTLLLCNAGCVEALPL